MFPYVLADDGSACSDLAQAVELVAPTYPDNAGYRVIAADLCDRAVPWRHDAARLAEEIMRFYRSHQTETSTSKEIKE
jgi:hypothetical protein